MNIIKGDFGAIFWTHFMLTIATYFSPMLFGWKIIISYMTFHYIQALTLKDCFLNKLQSRKDRKIKNFHVYYLGKIGLNIEYKKARLLGWIIPLFILSLALIWQVILDNNPRIM